jgi:hypothetical protein
MGGGGQVYDTNVSKKNREWIWLEKTANLSRINPYSERMRIGNCSKGDTRMKTNLKNI